MYLKDKLRWAENGRRPTKSYFTWWEWALTWPLRKLNWGSKKYDTPIFGVKLYTEADRNQ